MVEPIGASPAAHDNLGAMSRAGTLLVGRLHVDLRRIASALCSPAT
ncbi:MAG: putative leader peptide [Streptomycetales bacterium]